MSVQKSSSNVIEKVHGRYYRYIIFMLTDLALKCVCVAEHNARKMLIWELLNRTRLETLLRDSYGNYCVQVSIVRL